MKASILSEDENALRSRAATWPEWTNLADLSSRTLGEVTARHGIDFATALLYDRAARAHAAFIDHIDNAGRGDSPTRPLVAIVPAAFYKEKPQSGADGRVVREAAHESGLTSVLVPVSSTGTLQENARILLGWLASRAGEKLIIVSLCKGGADVKCALADPEAETACRNVRAWINVCGTLSGSPVAAWLLSQKLTFLATWLFFKCKGHDFDFLRELAPSKTGTLSAPLRLPGSMELINVVGFPLRRHLSNAFMRACYDRIAPLGPNDGGVLLADACRLPGHLYPLWGADHYLRPDTRSRNLLVAMFEYLKREVRVADQEAVCAGE